MLLCENCARPAVMFRGGAPTCATCVRPGEVQPLVESLPDLGGRRALSKKEAAESVGRSEDYFERHITPELRTIRRGRVELVPVAELDRWLAASAARALKGA